MRRIYTILSIILVSVSSCDEVLNIDSPKHFTENVIWSGSEGALNSYIIGHYGELRDRAQLNGLDSKFTDALSDIIKSGDWNQVQRYNRASVLSSYFTPEGCGILETWGTAYGRIKRENEFFRDLEIYKDRYRTEFIQPRVAEMHFIRAFSYFYLARVYGGVVIRTNVDGPGENDKPRATEEATWQFIIDELQLAVKDLPLTWGANNFGRITKAAGYGFLSRVALYAKQWDVAIEAAQKCKEAGGSLEPDYAKVFSNQHSKENLITVTFFQRNVAANLTTNSDIMFRPSGDATDSNEGDASASEKRVTILSWLVPTAELADEYEMADGTPFSWETHGSAPYTGREKRFYASILYNGAKWENRIIETFQGGKDGIQPFEKSGQTTSTVTGYYLKKFVTENDTTWIVNGSSHFDILLRYAEVLLNKAEALAQKDWNGNKEAALAALNKVRARAGLPAKEATSLEEFMQLIEHERMVELAGEGFRYWDLRRWRRSMAVLNGKNMHGTLITKEADGSFKYKKIDVDSGDTRVFMERYYAFSIPQAERTKNKALGENNPGW